MGGREGMPSFYLNREVSGSGSHAPPGFKTEANPNMMVGPMGSTIFSDGGASMSSSSSPRIGSESMVKKKRGRPRKYGGDGSHMALALVPTSPVDGSGSGTPTTKKNRGRPPGSGRKQRLANVGEWMCASAGLAFTPHIIHVETGEDVAAKIQSFAQQRPRGVCIMSGNGSVSVVQLRQFASSGGTVTYEGRFEILSLSGSYLLPETGTPNHRTGGLSISICSQDGHVFGGAIGGRLIASSLIQVSCLHSVFSFNLYKTPKKVVACSFVYGGNNYKKAKKETPSGSADEKCPSIQLNETSPAPSQMVAWSQDSRDEMRNPRPEIDLTHG
ncbi:hypothetical protein SSX86_005025 [Deinandra increscens subsp. villosa]|uniref:AT-hook motif nuclear-localized protein n=1 Tax=Deinandra increscens subsp. villosa TaxID=3103831 RepID=A0AAP0DKB1_9ASTR